MLQIPGLGLEIYDQFDKTDEENVANVSKYITSFIPGYAFEAIVKSILNSSGVEYSKDADFRAYKALKSLQK